MKIQVVDDIKRQPDLLDGSTQHFGSASTSKHVRTMRKENVHIINQELSTPAIGARVVDGV